MTYQTINLERTQSSLATMQVMPPNSPELEEDILGLIINTQDRSIMTAVAGLLTPGDFYIIRNRIIFEAALDLHKRGRIIDWKLLKQELINQNQYEEIGGPLRLAELTAASLWNPGIEGICHELITLTTRREMIIAAGKIAELAYDTSGSIEVQHARAIDAMRKVRTLTPPSTSLAEEASNLIDEMNYYQANPLKDGEVRGLATGIIPLDLLLGGIQLDDFIVIAGRPGTGKTALCLQAADQVAMSGKRVLILSYEMKKPRLLRRLASRRAMVDWDKVKRGHLTEDDYNAVNYHLVELSEMSDRLIIDDNRAGLAQIEAAIIKNWPLDLVVVDNLHIVQEPRQKHEDDTHYFGRISLGLFDLSKSPTHSVPVLTIAHMNRASERENRKPNKTDLRESGEIEQNADTVLFMWVPDQEVSPNVVELFAAKMRDGSTGTPARVWFDKPHQRFGRIGQDPREIAL